MPEKSSAYVRAEIEISYHWEKLMEHVDEAIKGLSVDQQRRLLIHWDLFDGYDAWLNED